MGRSPGRCALGAAEPRVLPQGWPGIPVTCHLPLNAAPSAWPGPAPPPSGLSFHARGPQGDLPDRPPRPLRSASPIPTSGKIATAILSVFLRISVASLPTGMRTPRGQGGCPEGLIHTGVPGPAATTTAEGPFGPRRVAQPQGPCPLWIHILALQIRTPRPAACPRPQGWSPEGPPPATP